MLQVSRLGPILILAIVLTCDSGQCTVKPFYQVRLHSSQMFKTTPLLSTVLLAMSGIGLLTLLFLLYLWGNTQCGEGEFQPPHRGILYCCFLPLPRNRRPRDREIKQLGLDNGIRRFVWLGTAEHREMLDQVRRKNCFQNFMLWFFWPSSIALVAVAFAWITAVDADEQLAFDL